MSQTEKMMKKMSKNSEKEDKKQEVAYIRGEKSADEIAAAKLAAVYGGGARKVDQMDRRSRAWKCLECKFLNYDVRAVCGECLAPNPAATQEKRKNIKLPGHSQDPFSTMVHVHGRSYRSFATQESSPSGRGGQQAGSSSSAVPTYRDDYDDDGEDDVEECDDDDGNGMIVRDPTDKEAYLMKLRVPSRYWKFLIGSKGSALQETQRLTGTTIVIPKSEEGAGGVEADIITIKAREPSGIRSAHLRINATILQCKDKVEYTHFLSIPLGSIQSLSKTLKASLDEMANLTEDEEKKVEPSIFQDPQRLHLTLLMLRLHSNEELSKAITIMSSLQRGLSELFRVGDRVSLRNLNYMNDDPTEVHVVYLEIEANETREKLIKLINSVNQAFIDAGLALEKDVAHNEKLHATMVNSKWRTSTSQGGPREAFNATDILKKFGRMDLGAHRLETIELSILGGGNALYGYFPSECSIEFPKS